MEESIKSLDVTCVGVLTKQICSFHLESRNGGQDISAALQHFIIKLFVSPSTYIKKNKKNQQHLNVALGHIVIFV